MGGVLLLWIVGPSIELFLSWIALTSLATSCTLGVLLWRLIPGAGTSRAGGSRIAPDVWRFAGGNLLIGLTVSLLTQAPGLIIANTCTLAQLAAYTLSMSLAQQVTNILTQPILGSLLPHFTQLSERTDKKELALEYHRWTQIIVVLMLPLAGILVVFARPLIEVWLGEASPLVGPVSDLLPWVVIGTALNTIVSPLYFLQMAAGWTRLSVYKNVIGVAILLPALLVLVPQYGPIAAAAAWIAINLGYYLFEVPMVHRRLLKREMWRWWLVDTLLPVGIVTVIFAGSALLAPAAVNSWLLLFQAAVTAVVAAVAVIIVLPNLRREALALPGRLTGGR